MRLGLALCVMGHLIRVGSVLTRTVRLIHNQNRINEDKVGSGMWMTRRRLRPPTDQRQDKSKQPCIKEMQDCL